MEHGAAGSRTRFDDAGEHGTPSSSSRPAAGPSDTDRANGAADADPPSVAIRSGPLPDGGCYVEDDGCGVPEELRERIFDPGVSTVGEGTEFGLAIVGRIADAHGWEVEVAARDDGARFEFRA